MTRITMTTGGSTDRRPLSVLLDLLKRKVITEKDLTPAEFDAVMTYFLAQAQIQIESKDAGMDGDTPF